MQLQRTAPAALTNVAIHHAQRRESEQGEAPAARVQALRCIEEGCRQVGSRGSSSRWATACWACGTTARRTANVDQAARAAWAGIVPHRRKPPAAGPSHSIPPSPPPCAPAPRSSPQGPHRRPTGMTPAAAPPWLQKLPVPVAERRRQWQRQRAAAPVSQPLLSLWLHAAPRRPGDGLRSTSGRRGHRTGPGPCAQTVFWRCSSHHTAFKP